MGICRQGYADYTSPPIWITLNLSTIECFLSNKYEGRSDLFEGRLVWEDENLRKLQGTYPVISLSFAGVKSVYDESEADGNALDNVEAMKTAVKQILSDVYAKFRDIMKSELFDENDRAYFSSVNDHMTDKTTQVAIRRLCGCLKRVYGKKAIVLLDEYDTPDAGSLGLRLLESCGGFFQKLFCDYVQG